MKTRGWFAGLLVLALGGSSVCWAQSESTDGGRLTTQGSSALTQGPAIDQGAPPWQGLGSKETKLKKRKQPVVLSFDAVPGSPWQMWNCDDGGSANVANGVMTIDSPSCYEYLLWHPFDVWHQYVDNANGWLIEARLKVDPSTVPCPYGDRGAVQIWAHDHVNLLIIGFNPASIGLAYPDVVQVPMNTTDGFHTYRVESKLNRVRIFVDDALRIDHVLTWPGGGSDVLDFGDGVGLYPSLSYWDYFSYDVFP